jgi:hypothetical protein
MPIDFPNSPTTGQVYTYQGKSWVYNGSAWDAPKALSEIGAVSVFANATARSAAIPTPTEGMVSYLNDVDRLEINNGSSWGPFSVASGGTGVTSFTSGEYLKGAGASAITSQSGIPAGDVTSGTLAQARMPLGSVLQVVSATHSTQVATTSGSFVYAGLEATITPRATSSRVLILATGRVEIIGSGVAGRVGVFANGQGGSIINATDQNVYSEGATDMFLAYAINHLHSPNTASSITYSIMFRRTLGGSSFIIQPSGSPSNLTLIEVQA